MPVSWKENIIDVTKIIEKRAHAIPYVTTLFFKCRLYGLSLSPFLETWVRNAFLYPTHTTIL